MFAFTPVENGGLGFSEAQIGTQLGLRSINNILVILLYTPLERRIGSVAMFKVTMAFWPLSMAFFPLLSALARSGYEGTWIFQAVLGLFVTLWSFACLAWSKYTAKSITSSDAKAMTVAASAIVINDACPSAEALSVINVSSPILFSSQRSIPSVHLRMPSLLGYCTNGSHAPLGYRARIHY